MEKLYGDDGEVKILIYHTFLTFVSALLGLRNADALNG